MEEEKEKDEKEEEKEGEGRGEGGGGGDSGLKMRQDKMISGVSENVRLHFQ